MTFPPNRRAPVCRLPAGQAGILLGLDGFIYAPLQQNIVPYKIAC